MNRLFTAMSVAVVLATASLSEAQQITNVTPWTYISTNQTSNTVIGPTTVVNCLNHEEVYVEVSFTNSVADAEIAGPNLFYWALGTGPTVTNFATGGTANWIAMSITPTNGTTINRKGTNIYVGSASHIALMRGVSGSTNAALGGLKVRYQFKDRRFGR